MPATAAVAVLLTTVLSVASCSGSPVQNPRQALSISWSNNLLTVTDGRLPGGQLEIWYLEAFCRSGAHDRDWTKTTLPHKTTLIRAEPTLLQFRTVVEPEIEVNHYVRALPDELELGFELRNKGSSFVDLQWFEPACIRVAAFTGCTQSNYTSRSFIFTSKGLLKLDEVRRTVNARYLGGQVYLPEFVRDQDANPRPICLEHPVNGLIGCISADNRWLLATASDRTHELFEGVYVCLHSDPRLNGLAAGERKNILSKIYLLPNDPSRLLERYQRDFPRLGSEW
jgi:hypothetical protein